MKTINAAICAAVAVLNNAGNWLKVTKTAENGTKQEFFATGINVYQDSFIKFHRQFSTSIYIKDRITDVHAAAENEISFLTEAGEVWTVEAAHNSTLADPAIASGNVDDMKTLVDWSRSRIDKAGNVLVVLDLRKLGFLTAREAAKIEKYMNTTLDGLGKSKQVCRTVYFEARNGGAEIYSGLYNLESDSIMTEGIWDCGFIEPENIVDLVEWELIQKTQQLVAYCRDKLEAEQTIPLF